MKKALKITVVIFSALTILFTNGCKKGATGPQGPQGKAGATVSSTTYTMSSWSYSAPYYYINLAVPELTDKNIDSSLVMVYFSTIGSNWFALPYTQYHSPADYYMGFVSSTGSIQVTWTYDTSLSSGSDPNTYYGTTIKCKVVVMPPAARKRNPNLNLNNYNEVKSAYNLKE